VVVLEPRKIRHKVEALNPALWKLGTREGLGSQWCNRLPRLFPIKRGEKGVVVGICAIRLLRDRTTFEPTLTYEQEDG
jgi:hypothetical protein